MEQQIVIDGILVNISADNVLMAHRFNPDDNIVNARVFSGWSEDHLSGGVWTNEWVCTQTLPSGQWWVQGVYSNWAFPVDAADERVVQGLQLKGLLPMDDQQH